MTMLTSAVRSVFRVSSRLVILLMAGVALVLGQFGTGQVAFARPTQLAPTAAQSSSSGCAQPPKTGDLAALSDAQLMSYNLPTHATIAADPEFWSKVLNHSRARACGSHPTNVRRSLPSSALTCNPNPGGLCQNYIWAGNQAVSGGRGHYTQATVSAAVPYVDQSIYNSRTAVWAGVGGDANNTSPIVLVQAGFDVWVDSIGNVHNTTFWEVVPGFSNEQSLNLCRLSTGDNVDVYVSSNLNGDGYDYFYLDNYSAGCYNSCYLHTSNSGIQDTCGQAGGPQYNSDSATGECILERVSSSAGFMFLLPDFGTEQITGCEINSTAIGSQNHNYLQVYNSSGQILASVGGIYNYDDFPVIWHQDG